MQLDDLHAFRRIECEAFLATIQSSQLSNATVLELGGGTGYQAKWLTEHGVAITSIDIETSNYHEEQVFPVQTYDGLTIPYEDSSFDFVISSNVLEHVPNLEKMFSEIQRVLKPGGKAIHILPTPTWRVSTTLAGHWLLLSDVPRRLFQIRKNPLNWLRTFKSVSVTLISGPERHGERGTSWTEIWLFSRIWWLKTFRHGGFHVTSHYPLRLFYTGHQLRGQRLGTNQRRLLSYLLGSACRLYVMKRL